MLQPFFLVFLVAHARESLKRAQSDAILLLNTQKSRESNNAAKASVFFSKKVHIAPLEAGKRDQKRDFACFFVGF